MPFLQFSLLMASSRSVRLCVLASLAQLGGGARAPFEDQLNRPDAEVTLPPTVQPRPFCGEGFHPICVCVSSSHGSAHVARLSYGGRDSGRI